MADFPANPFWDFSLAVYGRPGMAPACLALQDRHGLDVNLLLLCCWAGEQGRTLAPAEIEELVAVVRPWQEEVVQPLRAVRRWLKNQAAVPAGLAGTLREQILARELDAERLEQHMLTETLSIGAGAGSAETAAVNLKAYFGVMEIEVVSGDAADLAALLTAGFPGLLPLEALQLLS